MNPTADEEEPPPAPISAMASLPAPSGVGRDGPLGVWVLAILATLATILSRALEPSLQGVWEGTDRAITVVGHAAHTVSQLLAVGCMAAVVWLVMATVKSAQPQYLRALSVCVGMLVLLAVSLSAVNVILPQSSRLVVAGGAALIVLLSVLSSARVLTLRAAALVLGGTAISGVMRILTVLAATQAVEVVSERWGLMARIGATVSWGLDVGCAALAIAVLVTQPSARSLEKPLGGQPPDKTNPRWVVLALLAILPGVFVLGALLGSDPEESGVVVLLGNIASSLMIKPVPFVPDIAQVYLEGSRWITAVAFLALVPRSRMLAAAIALALFSRATLEVPLCAAALVIAALSLGVHPGPDLRREALPPSRGPA